MKNQKSISLGNINGILHNISASHQIKKLEINDIIDDDILVF